MISILMTSVIMMSSAPAPNVKHITSQSGECVAVIAERVPLVHTGQVFGTDANTILEELGQLVSQAGGDLQNATRLSVYAHSTEAAEQCRKAIQAKFRERCPAITCVVGKLVRPGAKLAIDAVVAGSGNVNTVRLLPNAAVLPTGTRVYISGQAEKGDTPAEATRKTLAGLKRTLEWLGCSMSDVVHAKSFLTPVSAIEEVNHEFEAAFGKGKVPPLSFVEWSSSLPIEIEFVVAAPKQSGSPAIEFLTPPWMTASPVYCRVCRTSAAKTIYLNGLYSLKPGSGAEEVESIFEQLKTGLDQSQSSLQHLVKATYYVSSNDTSTKLNELRPRYYDPLRPPAASKAMVAGTGMHGRALTIDMIAIPRD